MWQRAHDAAQERNAFYQQLEIDRILKTAFRLNPYDILDVTQEMSDREVQKAFRRKSLLIHPDKVKNDTQRAIEAFDLLKKASLHLQDDDKRKTLDETVLSARSLALKELGLPMQMPQVEYEQQLQPGGRLHDLFPSWNDRLKLSTKQLMLDDELRKRKALRMKQEAEAEARRERDLAEEEQKRKAEVDNRWEDTREQRVNGASLDQHTHSPQGGAPSTRPQRRSGRKMPMYWANLPIPRRRSSAGIRARVPPALAVGQQKLRGRSAPCTSRRTVLSLPQALSRSARALDARRRAACA